MLESKFKKQFVSKLRDILPFVEFFEPDPERTRSAPDMLVVGRRTWAALEFKRSKDATHRANQDRNIERLNKLGYATFVYPENEMEVLNDLEELFTS